VIVLVPAVLTAKQTVLVSIVQMPLSLFVVLTMVVLLLLLALLLTVRTRVDKLFATHKTGSARARVSPIRGVLLKRLPNQASPLITVLTVAPMVFVPIAKHLDLLVSLPTLLTVDPLMVPLLVLLVLPVKLDRLLVILLGSA